MDVSIVIPVYNEEGNIILLYNEIKNACEKENYEYEIILVDDGSTDRTIELAKTLSKIKIIRLRKNFGQTAAMDIGIKNATKSLIVTIDGDRQNDPIDIPNMINYLISNNLDVVSGWRKNRKDSMMKKFTSRVANLLRQVIVKDNIHDSGCSLKVYRRECFDNIDLYGEMHRFIPAILKTKGYTIDEIIVNHRARVSGVTKYNWKRSLKGFVDMISVWFWNKFAVRPLHLLGGLGIISLFLGLVSMIWTFSLFIMGTDLSNTFQPIMTIFFLTIGVLLFIFGLMSDILSKIYFKSTNDVPYSVKEIIYIDKKSN